MKNNSTFPNYDTGRKICKKPNSIKFANFYKQYLLNSDPDNCSRAYERSGGALALHFGAELWTGPVLGCGHTKRRTRIENGSAIAAQWRGRPRTATSCNGLW